MSYNRYTLIFSLLIISFSLEAISSPLHWSGNMYRHIYKYKKQHKKFFRQVCSPGTDTKYYKLLKKYRGEGVYLPQFKGDIDRKAIKANIHHFAKKEKYIKGLIRKLKKSRRIPSFKKISKGITTSVDKLLLYKKDYDNTVSEVKRNELKEASKKEIKSLQQKFKNFVSQIYFLKSFNFPNDHLGNRKSYADYKDSDKDAHKRRANKTFFYRRIVEDGAYNPDRTYPDIYVRSTLDTLYLTIQKEQTFISENVRYDLEWVLRRIKKLLSKGYKVQLSRLNEWRKRTSENAQFYRNIIKSKNKKKAKKIIAKKNQASKELRDFVYQKQAETYLFWKKQPELMKALFVLETILYNEVGVIDGPDALERMDVAKVVLNRLDIPFYRSLSKKQWLYEKIKLADSDIQSEYWLNVLFRVGEFSFTYHYISSVAKIFCPDMSRRGRNIRDRNLKISMKAINNPKDNFKAIRYFSRVSMLGKIDMSTVWGDFSKVLERPGLKVTSHRQKKLERAFLSNDYHYYYDFVDPKGVKYQVLNIHDKTYVMTWVRGRALFYRYRSPHLFTYFYRN